MMMRTTEHDRPIIQTTAMMMRYMVSVLSTISGCLGGVVIMFVVVGIVDVVGGTEINISGKT